MRNFTFNTTRSILAEAGASRHMGKIVRPVLGDRAVLVTRA